MKHPQHPPAIQRCAHCGEHVQNCECGNWWPIDAMFDDPEEYDDGD